MSFATALGHLVPYSATKERAAASACSLVFGVPDLGQRGLRAGLCGLGERVEDVGGLSGEGLARWRLLRFQPLPIQPCVKFSLTRLTDTVHRVACADAYRTVPASR